MESMHGSPMNEVTKIKVTKAKIIRRLIFNKPYFEIKYNTLDGETHIGYASYNLNNVLEYKSVLKLFKINQIFKEANYGTI